MSLNIKILILSLVNLFGSEFTLLQNSFPCDFEKLCICTQIRHTYMLSVNCDNKGLPSIPKLPYNIQKLIIRKNRINCIEKSTFKNNNNLILLDLSLNMIAEVHETSFIGLNKLETLILMENNINYTQVSLKNALRPLKNLRYLNIKKNCQFGSLDISPLESLQILKMDLVMETHSPATFNTTTLHRNVSTLDVSGFTGYCVMHTLTADTFKYFPNVERLDLSKCRMNSFGKTTLLKLTKLKYLDISDNKCLKFTVLSNISYSLQFSMIEALNISKLHQTFALSTELKRSHIEGFRHTKLRVLYANSNRLQLIEQGALSLLPRTLEEISVADNELSYGEYVFDAFVMPVKTFDVSFQGISHRAEYNEPCDNDKFELNSCDSRTGKDNNAQGSLYGNQFFYNKSFSGIIYVPYQLKTCICRHCKLKYILPNITVSNNLLEYIDVAYNIFYEWQGPILNLKHLRYLDLSNNFCSKVSNEFFTDMANLTKLHVQNNLLGFVLPDDKDGRIFEPLTKLKELNMAGNRIPSLPKMFFKAQLNMQVLNLSGNMLDNVEFDIEHMKNITFIDLSSNRFSVLSNTFMKALEQLSERNKNLLVDISGNPLKCTCETIDFVRGLATINLYKLDKYECLSISDEKRNLSNTDFLLKNLEKRCSSYSSLIIGVAISILVFTIIVICWFVFRFRWKLRYIYYMIKSRNHGYVKMETTKYEGEFIYDAFISYADKDGHFVYTKLKNNLELETGFKCCIHKRDFLPGEDIETNITSAIHNSRKFVVLMSYSFLDSYWCMFEFNMARMESIYSRQKENIIFLVFLEQIMPKDLPINILELVHSQSYIEYPNDNLGDIVFWDKMKRAITN